MSKNINYPSFIVLMYHRVSENKASDLISDMEIGISESLFEKQVKYLKQNFNVVTMNEIVSTLVQGKRIKPKTVAITFDDGYLDNYKNAFPILKKNSVPATIYLATGLISRNTMFWWDQIIELVKRSSLKTINLDLPDIGFHHFKQRVVAKKEKQYLINLLVKKIKESERTNPEIIIEKISHILNVDKNLIQKPKMMTWEQIIEMSNWGISFGGHTDNHLDLGKVDLQTAREEICKSIIKIEQQINKKVDGFAYPFGMPNNYSEEIIDILRSIGISHACVAYHYNFFLKNSIYEIPRYSPTNSTIYIFARDLLKYLQCQ